MKNKLIQGILIGAGILCLAASTVVASGVVPKSAPANDIAPDFTLTGFDGKTVSLKDFAGKGVILFFFTTWCPHCQDKFPMLVNEYSSIKKDGLELLVIDVGESETKVKSYAQKYDAPFEVLLDSQMSVVKAYGVMGVPTFFLIDKTGKIVFNDHELPANYKDILRK